MWVASSSAAWSTRPPREVFTRIVPGRIAASAAASIRWRVSGVERRVERDDVGACERACRSSSRPTQLDVHAERVAPGAAVARPIRPAPTIASRRAAQLEPEPALRLPRAPAPGARVVAGLGQVARGGEQQRHREVGGRVGQHVAGRADGDAARRARGEVDVVEADRVVARRRAASARRRAAPRRRARSAATAGPRRPRRARAAPRARAACRPPRSRRRALRAAVRAHRR